MSVLRDGTGFVPKADTVDRGRRRGARGAEPGRRAGGLPSCSARTTPVVTAAGRRGRAPLDLAPALKRAPGSADLSRAPCAGVRHITCLLAVAVAAAAGGCAGEDPAAGPRGRRRQGTRRQDPELAADRPRDAQRCVQADSGGAAAQDRRGRPAGQGPHQPLHDRGADRRPESCRCSVEAAVR